MLLLLLLLLLLQAVTRAKERLILTRPRWRYLPRGLAEAETAQEVEEMLANSQVVYKALGSAFASESGFGLALSHDQGWCAFGALPWHVLCMQLSL
jgi:hypothetical protein